MTDFADINWMERLRKELAGPLPGIKAQLLMSPHKMPQVCGNIPFRKSAVLVLLYPYNKCIYTVFIKRAEYNGVHSGQISFPGGIYKPEDVSLSVTALRETHEETGIFPDQVRVIGQLTLLDIPVSNTAVYPFVAVADDQPEFKPDPHEVQFVIEAGIHELLHPDNRQTEILQIAGLPRHVPYYNIRGHHIWGATAMIVSEFLEIYKHSL